VLPLVEVVGGAKTAPEAVQAATGLLPSTPRATPDLSKKPEKFERLPADGSSVKAFVRTFAANS